MTTRLKYLRARGLQLKPTPIFSGVFLQCDSDWRWMSLARGSHSCDKCGKNFTYRAHFKSHVKLQRKTKIIYKSLSITFVQIQTKTPKINIIIHHHYHWIHPHQGRERCKGLTGRRSIACLACVLTLDTYGKLAPYMFGFGFGGTLAHKCITAV